MDAVRAGVSADDFADVIRAYADRVHDDVRRIGATPVQAAEVVESSALALLETLRLAPQNVPDLVGAWFRDARVLADRVTAGADPAADELAPVGDAPAGLIRRSEDDQTVRLALTALPKRDRIALLLRDAYDLPYPAVAVALSLDLEATAAVVARARLRFAALAAESAELDVPGPDSEAAQLAQYADGALATDRAKHAKSHTAKCAHCRAAMPIQREARRQLSGLGIIALSDTRRDGILDRVGTAAQRTLPSAEVVAAAARLAGPRGRPRGGVVVACLAVAVTLGILVGLATSGGSDGDGSAPDVVIASEASPTASPTATASVSATATPTATASATSDGTPSESATATVSSGPTVSGTATITLSRTTGPNCALVQVRGRSFRSDRVVTITYMNTFGTPTNTRKTVRPNTGGTFNVSMQLCDSSAIPGPHQVVATNNSQRATATYTATT